MKETNPPLVLYQIVEARVWEGSGLEVHAGQVFADESAAEREIEAQRDAWETALAEWEDREEDPGVNAWEIDVQEIHLRDYQLESAERMDLDRYETMMDAVAAVGYGLVHGTNET